MVNDELNSILLRMNKIWEGNLDMEAIPKAVFPEFAVYPEEWVGEDEDDVPEPIAGLYFKIFQAFRDAFISLASDEGIIEWERVLEIHDTPVIDNSNREARRERVKMRLHDFPPYTENYVCQILDEILGVDGYDMVVVPNDYYINIRSRNPGEFWIDELFRRLEHIIPANMIWELEAYTVTWQAVYNQYSTWGQLYNSGRTWMDVLLDLNQ